MNVFDIHFPSARPAIDVVGRVWYAHNGQVYVCDDYDAGRGYWMTNLLDVNDRCLVSGRTMKLAFHPVVGQWSKADMQAFEKGLHAIVGGFEVFAVTLPLETESASNAVRFVDYEEARFVIGREPLFANRFDAEVLARRLILAAREIPPMPVSVHARDLLQADTPDLSISAVDRVMARPREAQGAA